MPPKKIKLSNSQIALINHIYQKAIVNPFSQEAIDLDNSAIVKELKYSSNDIQTLYQEQIENLLTQLDSKNDKPVAIKDFPADIQHQTYYTICFWTFHKYLDKLDTLAQSQLDKPDRSVPVSFGEELIEQLCIRGLAKSDAAKVLSFFYQLRRAWLFISTRLIGHGPSMGALRQDIWNNIFTHSIEIYEKSLWYKMEDFSTLILGPTGSGKGAAASAIGYSSYIPYNISKKQFEQSYLSNFIAVNLSQYPDTLVESELFGYARGAFTGAIDNYNGLFSCCGQYGTVFLDEIAEIDTHTQVKLLKVLEERTFCPLGSHKEQTFTGRVIGATHQPIDQLCRDGRFRDDLYYRLCSDIIRVPSLRQRLDECPEELEVMVDFLLSKMVGEKSPALVEMILTRITEDIPQDYQWPGNVRELAQVIRRIIIKQKCGVWGAPESVVSKVANNEIEECSLEELKELYCRSLYDKYKSYQIVSNITGLNWRTAKKIISDD